MSESISTNSIKRMLEAVQADKDAKRVFLAMPREEQLLAILGMIAFTNNQVANLQQDMIEYRHEREKHEQEREGRLLNTSERIADGIKRALGERFDVWTWFRDKVLPGVISLIVLAILYLTFGGKLP